MTRYLQFFPRDWTLFCPPAPPRSFILTMDPADFSTDLITYRFAVSPTSPGGPTQYLSWPVGVTWPDVTPRNPILAKVRVP